MFKIFFRFVKPVASFADNFAANSIKHEITSAFLSMTSQVNETEWNKAWWSYRTDYQGVTPPLERSEADFDPASKFHISNNVPYVR